MHCMVHQTLALMYLCRVQNFGSKRVKRHGIVQSTETTSLTNYNLLIDIQELFQFADAIRY